MEHHLINADNKRQLLTTKQEKYLSRAIIETLEEELDQSNVYTFYPKQYIQKTDLFVDIINRARSI